MAAVHLHSAVGRSNSRVLRVSQALFVVFLWNGVAPVDSRGQIDASKSSADQHPQVATIEEMIESRTDVWGDAAMRQPNGASYEFFVDLLPPLRWVNTDFRHYPIVLSAPRSPLKSRIVSNGSAVNAKANMPPMWYEQGTPVSFYVGDGGEAFGADLQRVKEPEYLDGYLPVVSNRYDHEGDKYLQEVFAPVDSQLAAHGVAMFRFTCAHESGEQEALPNGRVTARFESSVPLRAENGFVLNDKMEIPIVHS